MITLTVHVTVCSPEKSSVSTRQWKYKPRMLSNSCVDISCGCQIVGCQNRYFTANSPRENAQLEVRKRDKDSLKVSVKDFGICDNSWETLAKNRSAWRAGITSGAHSAEARRMDETEKKRAAQKARAGSTSALGSEHTCPTCGKDCRARIGLLSHLRTHRPISTSN